jgi:hypothetical protein
MLKIRQVYASKNLFLIALTKEFQKIIALGKAGASSRYGKKENERHCTERKGMAWKVKARQGNERQGKARYNKERHEKAWKGMV